MIVFAYYADMFDRDSSFSGEFEFVSAGKWTTKTLDSFYLL